MPKKGERGGKEKTERPTDVSHRGGEREEGLWETFSDWEIYGPVLRPGGGKKRRGKRRNETIVLGGSGKDPDIVKCRRRERVTHLREKGKKGRKEEKEKGGTAKT